MASTKARQQAYYLENRERIIARSKARAAKKKAEDPDDWKLKNQRNANRYLAKLKSEVHPDLDADAEMALFAECQRLTKSTGIVHHVDHIIPLVAGGWHHHLNMQVLPANVNREKFANPFWEKAGYKSWRDVPAYLWPARLVPAYAALLTSS